MFTNTHKCGEVHWYICKIIEYNDWAVRAPKTVKVLVNGLLSALFCHFSCYYLWKYLQGCLLSSKKWPLPLAMKSGGGFELTSANKMPHINRSICLWNTTKLPTSVGGVVFMLISLNISIYILQDNFKSSYKLSLSASGKAI